MLWSTQFGSRMSPQRTLDWVCTCLYFYENFMFLKCHFLNFRYANLMWGSKTQWFLFTAMIDLFKSLVSSDSCIKILKKKNDRNQNMLSKVYILSCCFGKPVAHTSYARPSFLGPLHMDRQVLVMPFYINSIFHSSAALPRHGPEEGCSDSQFSITFEWYSTVFLFI